MDDYNLIPLQCHEELYRILSGEVQYWVATSLNVNGLPQCQVIRQDIAAGEDIPTFKSKGQRT